MIEIRIPDLGLEDGEKVEVVSWRVKPGQEVAPGGELVDLGVDQAVFTMTAPNAGKLTEVILEENSKAVQGAVLCRME